jgi:hypothetical protein
LLAGAVVACGLKNAPVPPELVRPLPPAKITATAVRGGVQLRWRRPTQYTGGGRMRDLDRFDIERAPGAAGPFALAGTLTLADQQRFRQQRDLEWTDREVQPGATYAYRVIAHTVDGSRSVASPPVVIRYDPAHGAAPAITR